MKTTKIVITKRVYTSPAFEKISLDNEISLVLQTPPPGGPGENPPPLGENKSAPEYFNNDPYRMA